MVVFIIRWSAIAGSCYDCFLLNFYLKFSVFIFCILSQNLFSTNVINMTSNVINKETCDNFDAFIIGENVIPKLWYENCIVLYQTMSGLMQLIKRHEDNQNLFLTIKKHTDSFLRQNHTTKNYNQQWRNWKHHKLYISRLRT